MKKDEINWQLNIFSKLFNFFTKWNLKRPKLEISRDSEREKRDACKRFKPTNSNKSTYVLISAFHL